MAALVAVSRVDDYWHHWQDVFAGGLLGVIVASVCYLQFFPPPYDIDGRMPHVHLQRLAEQRTGTQSTSNNPGCLTIRQPEDDNMYAPPQHGIGVSEHSARETRGPIFDEDVENGRWRH